MDSKTLIKALKIAVRDVIKEELTEILRDGLQSTINEMKSTSHNEPRRTKVDVPTVTRKMPVQKNNVQFKETKWADILNETNALVESSPGATSLNELLTENYSDLHFTSNDAQGFGMMRNNVAAAPTVIEDPESGKVLQVDPAIAKAMTRDYSELMKAIAKKKGN
jgi:hypothetical protein